MNWYGTLLVVWALWTMRLAKCVIKGYIDDGSLELVSWMAKHPNFTSWWIAAVFCSPFWLLTWLLGVWS